MLSGVPNFAFTIGYTNASWTLKADLVAEYVCRAARATWASTATTVRPGRRRPASNAAPLLDFQAGYVAALPAPVPQAGRRSPWRLGMSYAQDVIKLRHGRLDDGALRFS